MTYRLISVNNCLLSLLTSIFTGAGAFSRSFYGPGTGPVHVDSIHCTGSEESLLACTRKPFGDVSTGCLDHSNDASVLCLSELFASIIKYECVYIYLLFFYYLLLIY